MSVQRVLAIPEMLQGILREVLLGYQVDGLSHTPIVPVNVNKAWRVNAIKCPELWTTIRICITGPIKDYLLQNDTCVGAAVDHFNTIYPRSGRRPVTLFVTVESSGDNSRRRAYREEIIKRFLSTIEYALKDGPDDETRGRVTQLIMSNVDIGYPFFLRNSTDPLHRFINTSGLTSLTLGSLVDDKPMIDLTSCTKLLNFTYDGADSSRNSRTVYLLPPPGLKTITIRNAVLEWYPTIKLFVTMVHSVTIENGTVGSRLRTAFSTVFPDLTVFCLSECDCFAVPWDVRWQFDMPKLQALNISVPNWNRIADWICPNLNKLRISDSSIPIFLTRLHGFARRNCANLEDFTIRARCPNIKSYAFLHLLVLMPLLRCLEIRVTNVASWYLDPFLEELCVYQICPRLANFAMYNDTRSRRPRIHASAEWISNLVKSRVVDRSTRGIGAVSTLEQLTLPIAQETLSAAEQTVVDYFGSMRVGNKPMISLAT